MSTYSFSDFLSDPSMTAHDFLNATSQPPRTPSDTPVAMGEDPNDRLDALLEDLAEVRGKIAATKAAAEAAIAPLNDEQTRLEALIVDTLPALGGRDGNGDKIERDRDIAKVTYTQPKPRRAFQQSAFKAAHPALFDEFVAAGDLPAPKLTITLKDKDADK